MSDFHQTGEVATLHSLDRDGLARLEIELEEHTRQQALALVLPALFSEFEGEAMRRIRSELAGVRYVRQIVVTLGRADREQFEQARRFFDGFPQQVVFLWVSGSRIQRLFELLEANNLCSVEDGKGRSCWLAYG
ncbi:MAG: glycosyl transferase, partial [Acidobacteria bacterium]|nr:glycosyl transferase [Acidobacteriota bacterium]